MKHLKDTDFKDDEADSGPRRARLRWVLLGSAGLIVVGAAGLFLLRKQVAEQALVSWCAGRGLACEADVTSLSLGEFSLSGLRVRSGDQVPFEADRVETTLHWTGLFSPEVRHVRIEGPILRGEAGPDGFSLYGLERLARPGTGGAAPPVEIESGRILLDTPAGLLSARAAFSGTLAETAQLRLELDPVDYTEDAARLSIPEARLVADWQSGQINAEAVLTIDEASLFGYATSALVLTAGAQADNNGQGATETRWTASAGTFSGPDFSLTGAAFSGEAAFTSLAGLSAPALQAALVRLSAQGAADAFAWQEAAGTALTAALALAPAGDGLAGPVAIQALDLVVEGAGSAREAKLAGELALADQSAVMAGRLELGGAQAGEPLTARLRSLPEWPGLLAAHGTSLSAALERAASGFDAGSAFDARLTPQGWSAEARGPAGLNARSGLAITIAPALPGEAWLRIGENAVSMSGAVRAGGGGLPGMVSDDLRLSMHGGETTLEAADLALEGWRAGGRSLGGTFRDIRLAAGPAGLRAGAGGTLILSGDWAGTDLAATRIEGRVRLEGAGGALEVRTDGAPCLAVSSAGFTLAAVTAAAFTLRACPEGGVILAPRAGGPGGRFALGDVAIPLSMDAGTGALSLTGAALDYTLAGRIQIDLTAGGLSLPLNLQAGTLTISGASPAARLDAGAGPLGLALRLAAMRVEGGMLPAVLTAPSFRLDGHLADDGLTGALAVPSLLIEDKAPRDPLFNPLITDFAGEVTANQLTARMPLRLRRAGTPVIGEAATDIDILSLTGTAAVSTGSLLFQPDGLQPDMLSGRLTGFFTDAGGSANAAAAFRITGGQIAGTARLTVSDFGFQTTRLGRVEGVSGEVVFSDVMGLTTVPENRIQIASVNPGIPLRDGVVSFELIAGETLRLSSVNFPFAGGTLSLAPMDWPFASATQEARLEAKGIELAELVEILRLPDTRATGTVSGNVPITFTGSSVRVNDAVLTADPVGGRLAYTGGATGAAAEEDMNARLAFEALRDLEFSVLEIGLSGDLAGRMRARMRLSGRNLQALPMDRRLTVAPGQPFEFAMDFDLPIGELLAANRQLFDQSRILSITSEILRDRDREGE